MKNSDTESGEFKKPSFAKSAFRRIVLLSLTLIPSAQATHLTNEDVRTALISSQQNAVVEPNQKEADFEENTSELLGEWGTELDDKIRRFLDDPESVLEPSKAQEELQKTLGDIFEP